jgi:hypothetical protein
MQGLGAQVPPAIQAAEHCAAGDAGDTDPVEIGLYQAEAFQGRCVMGRAEVFPVTLALRQEQAHASTGFGLDMLDLQSIEFVAAKAAPEADQQQRSKRRACRSAWSKPLHSSSYLGRRLRTAMAHVAHEPAH